MKKRETKKLTPERLQQFGFAYAPPLIISAAVNKKVFDTLEGGAKTVDHDRAHAGHDEGTIVVRSEDHYPQATTSTLSLVPIGSAIDCCG